MTAPTALSQNRADYRLGPGDLIEIAVFGVDTFRHTLRVNGSGVIKVPMLDPITVAGMTTTELEQQLRWSLQRDLTLI